MTKHRVAVIGLGRIGAGLEDDPYREKPCTHLGAWAAHSDRCEIVGVCDSQMKAGIPLLTSGEKMPPFYQEHQKLLTETHPEIVSIATPDDTHKVIARNTVGYDGVKMLFLEKPIAQTLDEADAIISRARNFNVKIAINHTRRWDPIWQHAAKLCYEEPPLMMLGTYGGDPIREGVHMADLFRWYGPKQSVVIHPSTTVDYLIFEVDLFWKDRRIHITQNGRLSEMYQSFPSRNYDSYIRELEKTCEVRKNLYPRSPMYLAAGQLLDVLDGKDDLPYCTGEDGRKALEMALTWK